MSQAKLTLRPPPNIDFVQGYPGIPPGPPDRPQAAVKGAIEVRVGPQGVKAKWVRIELRKVETLPGGGVANTFFDPVGQSPINVWQSGEEYGILHTQDFPFYIRIPESIPPSIALEKGAGIKYELIAAVCIKGKRGLLRRDKPVVAATSSQIIIDKHELHSTWPVYSQPESRSHTQDGVTLTVDRSHTCYGPGDRIIVMATVKSDGLHTVILRGFEFTLRETTVFRASPHTHGKKGAPQVKVASIGEQKVPVNVTLYGGTQHKAELTAVIPPHHTSATLNAARHIDITYNLIVKALMGTGQPVVLDLPVIVSNWPRTVSQEAMRRIGTAPNVSLPGHTGTLHIQPELPSSPPALQVSQSIISITPQANIVISAQPHPYSSSEKAVRPATTGSTSRPALGQFNTAPTSLTNGYAGKTDEFGMTKSSSIENSSRDNASSQGSSYDAQTIGGTGFGRSAANSVSSRTPGPHGNDAPAARPRNNSARAVGAGSRLTVANLNDQEIEEHTKAERMHGRQASLSSTPTPRTPPAEGLRAQWLSAEDEKRRLYETAIANVERVQGNVIHALSMTDHAPSDASSTPPLSSTTAKSGPWPTAEDEKTRLFNQAQAAVLRTRGLVSSPSASSVSSGHGRNGSLNGSQSWMAPTSGSHGQMRSATYSPPGTANSSSASRQSAAVKTAALHYASAEDEKAALRRYHEAKAAVDRTQGAAYGIVSPTPPSAPISYDALYLSNTPKPSSSLSAPVVNGSTPPFVPSSTQSSHPSDEGRRAYEAQNAARTPNVTRISSIGTAGFTLTTPDQPSTTGAAAEKEKLRRKFEAQDTAALTSGPPAPPPRYGAPPPTPPPSQGSRPTPTPPRSPPVSPHASGSRPMTAAEEKARLRAMYEASDQGARPNDMSSYPSPPPTGVHRHDESAFGASAAPPPLLPRPPKEYIQETQEEDIRTYAEIEAIDKDPARAGPQKAEVLLSSFNAGLVDSYGNPVPAPGPPPPLPPKVLLE
ncbi:hypothetical protein BKA93DRAFT_511906 [Sparassis latifolia]